jgi:hypothetical protein
MPNPRLANPSLLTALLLAACSSSDQRPLVVIDMRLGPGATAPDVVRLIAASAGQEVKRVDVEWKPATTGLLEVGLYIPENAAGPITISGKALKNDQVVAEGAVAEEIYLVKGGQVGPYALLLSPSIPPPATGLDGGMDGGGLDVIGGPDVVAVMDVSPRDGGVPDAITAEGDTSDVPSQPDLLPSDTAVPDSPLPPTDGAPADAADASEPGSDALPGIDTRPHASAWESAQNLASTDGNGMFPAVAVAPASENVYLAWADGISVKTRRWLRSTGTWDKTVQVEDRGRPNVVQMGVDGKGNIILVWTQDKNFVTDDTLLGVWTSRSADGLSWSPPVRIAALAASELYLAVSRNGTARAVFTKIIDYKHYLYTAYFDATSWTESAKEIAMFDPSKTPASFRSQLVVSPTGDGLLAFNSVLSDGTVRAVVALNGATVGAPTVMNPTNASNWLNGDTLAVNRKGEGVFVWSEGDGAQVSIYVRMYNPAVGWGTVPPRIAAASDISGDLAATLDEQGNITAVWQQYLPMHGMNLVGIHGSLAGSWSEVTQIETDNHAATEPVHSAVPKMAIDAQGNSLLVWLKDESTTKALDYSNPRYGAYGSGYVNGAWLPQVELGQKAGLTATEVNLSVSDDGLGAAVFYYYYWPEPVTADADAYSAMVSFFR